ncbi:ATP-binding protein [Chryseobacterium taklimakanense]|uniref:histidine kinase n=1 Tax=Chryseobacterium taklimakanense TaxID=536441 RepID=A0A3G8WI29_9FLAO|nr:ATP-binding protein [Chryseobacterium taklimakanense]AZI20830.1 HAMP domain-containing protein [Chryseobacterium taklimakanense]
MNVKTKLLLGVGALFLMIVALSAIGAIYINKSKRDTKNILVANYNSLIYSKNMIQALDDFDNPEAVKEFEKNVDLEGKNLTEKGEKESWLALKNHFFEYKSEPSPENAVALRNDIVEIMRQNMEAIQRKSDIAIATSENAYIWIIALGTFCFLVASSLLFNIPHSISNPISTLTKSIDEISKRNYSERINLPMDGEFGQLAGSFNIMAQKLEEYENSNLNREIINKKRVETLIENMHDPVIGLDDEGKIVFINQESLKVSGLVKTDVLGKTASNIAIDNDLIREILQREKSSSTDSMKIYADDKESYFDLDVVPISFLETGKKNIINAGKVLILRNITRYKELEYAKTNFIATISHELKTPISAIKMGTQLLKNENFGDLNLQQQELVNSIEEDGQRLLDITGELLNMSQVESGNIKLNITDCSVKNLLNAAYTNNIKLAQNKSIKITLENKVEENATVTADFDKTVWVLNNFITNAIKHSFTDGEIILGAEKLGDRSRFFVKDFGNGIDEKFQNEIFDRYFQVPGSNQNGTGLGLSICKSFIEKMNGEIGVDSTGAEGSRFWFLL